MTSMLTHPLITACLRDPELLLHGVEPGERAEVLAGVHEHLDASLATGASDDEGPIRARGTRLTSVGCR